MHFAVKQFQRMPGGNCGSCWAFVLGLVGLQFAFWLLDIYTSRSCIRNFGCAGCLYSSVSYRSVLAVQGTLCIIQSVGCKHGVGKRYGVRGIFLQTYYFVVCVFSPSTYSLGDRVIVR